MADINLDGSGGGYWGSGMDLLPKNQLPTSQSGAYGGLSPTGAMSDSGGNLYSTPGYTPPAAPSIGQNGSVSVPRPSVNQGVIYTDQSGNAYDPGTLAKAMQDPTFANNPANARVGDLLAQYQTPAGGSGSTGSKTGPYGGTSIFQGDPSTASFENLLNGITNQFATAQTPPDQQQAVNQLNAYLKQLNGPAYTPEQMGMLQTQALDPINQQHDQARQQLMQQLASRGITPSSGIAQQALQQLDASFETARTQAQNQFATNAIGLSRQNAATAASLAPQISQFEYNNMTAQDPRNLQAINLASMIPLMAQQRLSAAQGSLQNPAGISPLLTLLSNFQNTGYNQGANYGSAIAQLLAQYFGQ